MSFKKNVLNYFFGTEVVKQYICQRDTLDDLCAEIRHLENPGLDLLNFHSERHSKKFKSILYEFCDITLSKILPDFFTLSSLGYGILTREWFNCSVGITISEGARFLIGVCFYDYKNSLEMELQTIRTKIKIQKHGFKQKNDCNLDGDNIPILEEIDNDNCSLDMSGYDGWLNPKECDD